MIVAALCERRFFKTAAVIDRRYNIDELRWTRILSKGKVKIEKQKGRKFAV